MEIALLWVLLETETLLRELDHHDKLFTRNELPKSVNANNLSLRTLKPLNKETSFMKIAPINKTPSFSGIINKRIPMTNINIALNGDNTNSRTSAPFIPLDESPTRRSSCFAGTMSLKDSFRKTSSFHQIIRRIPENEPEPFTPLTLEDDGGWTMRLNKVKSEGLSPKSKEKQRKILERGLQMNKNDHKEESNKKEEEEPKLLGPELFNQPSRLKLREAAIG